MNETATTTVQTKGGVVRATLTRDADGCRAVRLSGASGSHVVTCDAPRGGYARAEGHAVGFLQEACYGLSVEESRALGADLVARLVTQVDPTTDRPMLSYSVTTTTGYVRVSGRNRAGRVVPVATAKASLRRRDGKRDAVWIYVRKSLPAYLAAAVEAARGSLEEMALRGRARKLAYAADQRRARKGY